MSVCVCVCVCLCVCVCVCVCVWVHHTLLVCCCSVRAALLNTAVPLPRNTPLDGGQGVAQVHAALQQLAATTATPTAAAATTTTTTTTTAAVSGAVVPSGDVGAFWPEYDVSVGYYGAVGRGVYLRDEGHFAAGRVEAIVTVDPRFHKDTPKETLINFGGQLCGLFARSSCSCSCPSFFFFFALFLSAATNSTRFHLTALLSYRLQSCPCHWCANRRGSAWRRSSSSTATSAALASTCVHACVCLSVSVCLRVSLCLFVCVCACMHMVNIAMLRPPSYNTSRFTQ